MNATTTNPGLAPDIPLSLVRQFAPTILFHPDEQVLPCSIEDFLAQSTLHAHTVLPIGGQTISSNGDDSNMPAPACAFHRGQFVLVYTDASQNLVVSRSSNGMSGWSSPKKLWPGANPTLASHSDGKLWMVYVGGRTMCVTNSSDGLDWATPWVIEDQSTYFPALTSFDGQLWIVYTSNSGTDLYSTNSTDGHQWIHRGIAGRTSRPALTAFGGSLWMTYTSSDSSQLYSATSSDGIEWTAYSIDGQHTSVPALASFDDALCMVYSDAHSSAMWATRSGDGIHWSEAQQIPWQHTSVPCLAASDDILCMVYPDALTVGDARQLWASLSPDGVTWQCPDVPNPTQQDMATHWQGQYDLVLNEGAVPGGSTTAPMYYAVQTFADRTEITYVHFYAYNGCQTVRIPLVVETFDCILRTYARHDGDLERVTVAITNDPVAPEIKWVVTEAHGAAKQWWPEQLQMNGASSAIIHASLNAHGTFNRQVQGDWISVDDAVVADFGDAIGDGATWMPSDFRLVGLDADGNPVSDQVWAKFCGRLGGHSDNSLVAGTNFAGENLPELLWEYIYLGNEIAEAFHKLPADATSGDGPEGLGTRAYISPAKTV